jgi:DNA-binding transcriptional LysR family regulator
MDIEDLRLFVDVARKHGFAAVARARNVDPSAISRTIAALEDQVGVRLFQRTTRKVELTDAGELFLDRVAKIVDDFDATCDDVRSVSAEPSGVLRMTASHAFGPTCIAPLLPKFNELYPKIVVELVLSDEQLDLVADRIELAIRLGGSNDKSLVCSKLIDTRYHVCISPDYRKNAKALRVPSDLVAHRCLLFPFGKFRTQWSFRRAKERKIETVNVDGDLITSSALTIRACVLQGMGPALLPSWLVGDDIKSGRLVDAFPLHRVSATTEDTAAWMIFPSRNHVSGRVRAMMNYLRANIQQSSM